MKKKKERTETCKDEERKIRKHTKLKTHKHKKNKKQKEKNRHKIERAKFPEKLAAIWTWAIALEITGAIAIRKLLHRKMSTYQKVSARSLKKRKANACINLSSSICNLMGNCLTAQQHRVRKESGIIRKQQATRIMSRCSPA